MARFLSEERKLLLRSAFIGAILILVGATLVGSSGMVAFVPGALLMLFTYIIFPFVMGRKRSISFIGNLYLNAESKDVTSKMPKFGMLFVLLPSFVFISWLAIDLWNGLIVALYGARIPLFVDIRDFIFTLTFPYLLIHAYFFIKDLPVISLLALLPTGNGTYRHHVDSSSIHSYHHNLPYKSNSFYNDRNTDPYYSFLISNIYHHRKH